MGEVLVDLLWVTDDSLLVGILGQVLQVLLLLLRDYVIHGIPRVLALVRELGLSIVRALPR